MVELIYGSIFFLITCLATYIHSVSGDPNDWVNINYVVQSQQSQSTTKARASIINDASFTAHKGPWDITNTNILPPSENPHDYLSWAPYHWPDCNWCGKGYKHIALNPNSTTVGHAPPPSNTSNSSDDSNPRESDTYTEEIGDELDVQLHEIDFNATVNHLAALHGNHTANLQSPTSIHHRLRRRSKRDLIGMSVMASDHNLTTASPSTTHTVTHSQPITSILNQADSECTIKIPIPYGAVATDLPSTIPENAGLFGSQTTEQDSSSTLAPGAEDPARARKGKCTPSTTHLAPSATWTTCPYVVKDGRVNPDVRTLQGVPAINDASQSILYNAIAYALNPNGSYSHNVATSIDAFFFSPSSRMNPNLNFGQVVRGPGHKGQQGTFTGILDFRGIVKIVNGIFIMRGTTAPDWTMERDQGMTTWMSHYKDWLQTSSLGIEAASRPNNHGSFFASQLAAAQMLVGDTKGAMTTLQKYFSNQFQDQIASSGEQPFEAVRTRPYHYRCFNLEAMITNAKLGDQLGLNLWTTKSKYGATVQDALDYTMKLDPKHEEVGDIFPHVSAVAAAYGDPDGKYGAFLQKTDPDYQSHPFWYYDQTIALPNSPAAQAVVGNGSSRRSISDQSKAPIKFTCPVIFDNIPQGQTVEIADGIFVTCDQLKGFYLGTSD